MAKLSEIVAEIESLEDVGTPENLQKAAELRGKVEKAGYGDRLPVAKVKKPEEPSFLDKYGRIIAEAGGSLAGGAVGLPGGIPGIMAGAALGSHGAGMGYDALTGSPPPSPQDQVFNALANATGGPAPSPGKAPQALAGLVPEGGLFDYGKAGINPVNTPLQQAEDVVNQRGGMLTAGQKGSTVGQKMEAWLESTPFGSSGVNKQRETTRGIFGDLLNENVPMAGTRESVGQGAAEGYQKSLDQSQAYVEGAYRELDNIMSQAGGDQRISMESLQNLMYEYDNLVARDPGFAEIVHQDPDLMRSMNAMKGMIDEGTTPTYDIIKRLRTMVGNKVGDTFYQGGEKTGLRNLYRVLTEDLDRGAFEIAGESALHARKTADALNHQLMVDIKRVDPIFSKAANPTDVYKALSTSLLNNPSLAADAKKVMGPNQWERFVDSWLNMAAMPTAGNANLVGEYSENTFLTTMNRLRQQSPEGYRVLTEGKEGVVEIIEALAGALQQGDRYFNRSNTANALGMQQMASQFTAGVVGGGAGLLAGGPTAGVATAAAVTAGNIALQKLGNLAMTNAAVAKALRTVNGKYGTNLPIGRDLARALISAGAPTSEIEEIFNGTE